MPFDYAPLFRTDLPIPAKRWGGFPDYNFIGGHSDAGSVPADGLIEATRRVLAREGETLSTYGLTSGPQGYRPLRAFLAESLGVRTGMRDGPDDVLIVSGSGQALDLVNAVLLELGDTVIVEAATYGGALSRLARLGVRYVGAPLDDGGIRMDALDNILGELNRDGVTPKYIYTIPTIQNPTGSIMPESRRLEMLRIAKAYGVPIFEDDCYADLSFDGVRPKAIRALDDDGQVIFCGSFSKTVGPALRIGYLIADWDVMARLLSVKNDGGTSALAQMVLAEYCTGHFDEHVTGLRGILKRKCETMIEAIAAEFGTAAEVAMPKGGIVVWVTLPDAVDTGKITEAAAADGIAINAGPLWTADPEDGRHRFRLCYAHPSEQEIRDGVARLAEICHRETGIPTRSGNVERPV